MLCCRNTILICQRFRIIPGEKAAWVTLTDYNLIRTKTCLKNATCTLNQFSELGDFEM